MTRAAVIGAGPNGLAAAIVLARAGLEVTVFEAQAEVGGAARTLPLTLPGFLHDFGSAVYPMAAGSPFFATLPLQQYGLQWIHSPAALAHPFDNGTAVTLERDLAETERVLGEDGKAWRKLMEPVSSCWTELSPDLFAPLTRVPRHPLQLARLGLKGFWPATSVVNRVFRNYRTKGLFAGLAAHSFLSLDEPLTAAFAIVFGAAAHAIGWPIPRGGAQSIANALCSGLKALGGSVITSRPIQTFRELPGAEIVLCDVTPRQLLVIAGESFSESYRRSLQRFRYGPGAFKVDYALSQPIPWKAPDCLRAATVHLGGTWEEIAASEAAMRNGRHAEQPFVLLAQPTLFDPSRAPDGKHIAWAYCHVPNGSHFDMLPRLEGQIERFAPGFRDCILDRRVLNPQALESMDANLVGGDIAGGESDLRQFFFRPNWRTYATSRKDVYLCSSSTPPGAGVHGMCGYNAAMLALHRMRL